MRTASGSSFLELAHLGVVPVRAERGRPGSRHLDVGRLVLGAFFHMHERAPRFPRQVLGNDQHLLGLVGKLLRQVLDLSLIHI